MNKENKNHILEYDEIVDSEQFEEKVDESAFEELFIDDDDVNTDETSALNNRFATFFGTAMVASALLGVVISIAIKSQSVSADGGGGDSFGRRNGGGFI